jgi:hypothetical protein
MPAGAFPPAAAAPAPGYYAPPIYSAPPALPPEKTMSVFGKIGIGAISLLAVVSALASPIPESMSDGAEIAGYRFGRLIATILFPFLISYAVAGRRKARNPNLFAGLFCGIGFFMLLISAAGSAGSMRVENSDQKVSRLMREAAGLQPVRTSIFGEPKSDTKLRGLFKDIINVNKEYQQATEKFDVSLTARLATPESFADPSSVADGLKVMHSAYALDAQQEQRMQAILDNFRHGFDDLPASDRETILNGFNAGLSQVMPARQRAISTEKAWIDSMDDAYSYAQAHHTDFSLSSAGHLAISDNDVREEFNRRIHALNDSRAQFMQAKSAFDRMQGESFKKMGISREQTGLH